MRRVFTPRTRTKSAESVEAAEDIGRSVPQHRDIYDMPVIGRVYTVGPK